MQIRTLQNVSIRYGEPSGNAPIKGSINKGFSIEVVREVGDAFNGSSVWYKDKNGDYIHCEGVEELVAPTTTDAHPSTALIDWGKLISLSPGLSAARGRGVRVAILDSGLRADHKDLLGIPPDHIIDVTGSKHGADDKTGHGTHCAGLIKANSTNGTGIIGLAPDCELFVIKVAHEDFGYKQKYVCQGMREAIRFGAQIVSMSFSIHDINKSDLKNAISVAWTEGLVLLASAGENESLGRGKIINYPALDSNCIAIGTVNASTYTGIGSSGYSEDLQYMLPEKSIWSCWHTPNVGYESKAGSSMATALVSALVARIIECEKSTGNSISREMIMAKLDSESIKASAAYDFTASQMRLIKA
jgi:subtilisin